MVTEPIELPEIDVDVDTDGTMRITLRNVSRPHRDRLASGGAVGNGD